MLARCVNLEEVAKRLSEVHERTCYTENEIPLYRRLQRLGYFWPDMKTQASEVQSLAQQANICSIGQNHMLSSR